MHSYKDLIAWQKAMVLNELVYRLTGALPRTERRGLVDQMRRSANSIPSNLAEGYRMRTNAHILHYARIAFGSASELETQVLLTKRLRLALPELIEPAERCLDDVQR